jgi:hypothetical protein
MPGRRDFYHTAAREKNAGTFRLGLKTLPEHDGRDLVMLASFHALATDRQELRTGAEYT